LRNGSAIHSGMTPPVLLERFFLICIRRRRVGK
jgi:hypothetical protein